MEWELEMGLCRALPEVRQDIEPSKGREIFLLENEFEANKQ